MGIICGVSHERDMSQVVITDITLSFSVLVPYLERNSSYPSYAVNAAVS